MKKAKIIIISVASVAIVANIVLLATGNSSISYTIQNLSGKYPVIPFAVGFLCGHWFFPIAKKEAGSK
jgi:hypothetical protein